MTGFLQTALSKTSIGVVYCKFSFSRVGESTTDYTCTPCVGSFTSPGIDIGWKGPTTFSVSSERQTKWVERNCPSFETAATRRLRGDQIEVFKIVNGYEDVDRNMFFKLKEGSRTR